MPKINVKYCCPYTIQNINISQRQFSNLLRNINDPDTYQGSLTSGKRDLVDLFQKELVNKKKIKNTYWQYLVHKMDCFRLTYLIE